MSAITMSGLNWISVFIYFLQNKVSSACFEIWKLAFSIVSMAFIIIIIIINSIIKKLQ